MSTENKKQKTYQINDFLEALESRTAKQSLTIFYGSDPDKITNFINFLAKYINIVELQPQSFRYEFSLITEPSIIIINNPDKKDLYNHISLNSLDRIKALGRPVVIATNYLPNDILNKTSPILMFHDIRVVYFDDVDIDQLYNESVIMFLKNKATHT
jgi:hypothetical protein